MSAQNSSTKSVDDSSQSQPAQIPKKAEPVSTRSGKEMDNFQSEEKLLAEVVNKSHEADRDAEKKVQQEIGEARLAKPEINMADDVLASGVRSPQKDANDVISDGSTLTLPIGEKEYKSGSAVAVSGKSDRERDVVGVSSISALVMFIGRIIKSAHKHAKRIIFSGKDK